MATDFSRIADASGNDLVVQAVQIGASNPAAQTGFHTNLYTGTVTSVTTTSTTITAAILLGGILVDSNAGAVTATFDTAANIVAGVNAASAGANVGDLFALEVINGGNTAGAITVAAGGGTFDANVPAANRTVAINTAKTVFVQLTNVTSGSEAFKIFM